MHDTSLVSLLIITALTLRLYSLSLLSSSYLERASHSSHSLRYLRTAVTLCTLSNPVCFTPRSKSETISVKVLSSQFPLLFIVSHHLHSPFELISSLSHAKSCRSTQEYWSEGELEK